MDDPKRSEEEQREEEEKEREVDEQSASDLDLPDKDAEQAQGGMVSRWSGGDDMPVESRR